MISPEPIARAQSRLRFVACAIGALALCALVAGVPGTLHAQVSEGVQKGAREGNKAAGPIGGVLGTCAYLILLERKIAALRVIEALVALRQMFDYSDKVRSLTQGRASWTMEPSAYAPVPEDILRQMLNPDGF